MYGLEVLVLRHLQHISLNHGEGEPARFLLLDVSFVSNILILGHLSPNLNAIFILADDLIQRLILIFRTNWCRVASSVGKLRE